MALPSKDRAQWLARWVLPHEGGLRTWLSRRPLAGLEVDDVVQESYSILAGMACVDHIRNPRTYLFEVAKSVVLLAMRRSRVVPLSTLADRSDLEVPSDAPGPEEIAAGRQDLARVAALISSLPPKCREAFTLRKVHGLSQREVAERMAISENTVEKHIGKALRLLANEIGYGGNRAVAASTPGEDEIARLRKLGVGCNH